SFFLDRSTTCNMLSFSAKVDEPTTVRLWRLLVMVAGAGALAAAVYRVPAWLAIWTPGFVAATVAAAAALLVLAFAVALQGSARAVERVALEIVFLTFALMAGEAILLGRSPELWSDDSLAQRVIARERAALRQGVDFDERLRPDVIDELRARGLDAVSGVAQTAGTTGVVASAVLERGLLPLSNASNAYVVECNEGNGYFQFRSDDLGFNNPPGLAHGPIDIAVVGESFALGHCVAPSRSAVELLRARHPRTANFGVAGSRVLSQLGVMREYVQPLRPPLVLWFVNTNFAEPRQEADQPLLTSYLDDPAYSQHLRERAHEVDAFIREVLVPLNRSGAEELREELDVASRFPLERLFKMKELRSLLDFGPAARRAPPAPDLSHFQRALEQASSSVQAWGGRLVVVILPSYEISTGLKLNNARYEAVRNIVAASTAGVVDGVALFAAQPDYASLYTLRIDNHPNAQGHALIAAALLTEVEHEEGK
ncbi:MAG TPA: hypothetical protein VM692_12550, partial [Gammaproteobacteria bacterium]|nr:hypothetical protein [Gammaproteobacteria bacterium]